MDRKGQRGERERNGLLLASAEPEVGGKGGNNRSTGKTTALKIENGRNGIKWETQAGSDENDRRGPLNQLVANNNKQRFLSTNSPDRLLLIV